MAPDLVLSLYFDPSIIYDSDILVILKACSVLKVSMKFKPASLYLHKMEPKR